MEWTKWVIVLQEMGIEPITLRLVDNPLYLLSRSHPRHTTSTLEPRGRFHLHLGKATDPRDQGEMEVWSDVTLDFFCIKPDHNPVLL